MNRIARWFRCHILGDHLWTTDFIERGKKPPEFIKTMSPDMVLMQFHLDNIMYCKHCGKFSDVNK